MKKRGQNPTAYRGVRYGEIPSGWIISLLLCSVTLSSSRHCLAFTTTHENTCQRRGRKQSFRKGTARFASTIEKPSVAGLVNQSEYETGFAHFLIKETDYGGNLINVTNNTPYLVNGHSQPTTSRRGSIVQDDNKHTNDKRTNKPGKKKGAVEKLSMWRRRHARSAQEGIRREKLPQLSYLFERACSL